MSSESEELKRSMEMLSQQIADVSKQIGEFKKLASDPKVQSIGRMLGIFK